MNNSMPLRARALTWFNSWTNWFANYSAITRDSKLKRFESNLIWIDRDYEVRVTHNSIYAKDELEARRLANEQAAKDAPLILPTFDPIEIVPPYIKDPAATLALWAMKESPLNADEQALAKRGELGPPRASDTMPTLGKLAPGTAPST